MYDFKDLQHLKQLYAVLYIFETVKPSTVNWLEFTVIITDSRAPATAYFTTEHYAKSPNDLKCDLGARNQS